MFPESDSYSGKGGKIFDLFLILFAIAVILFAILTAPPRPSAHPRKKSTPADLADTAPR